MDRYRADSISRERVSAGFMLGFGAFGLMLAALGVYGVMAFSITNARRSSASAWPLAPASSDILPLVLRRSAVLVGIGLLSGTVVAVALNRVLASILTEVGPIDVAILAGATLSIVATAGVACLLPAIAAARLDPVKALRAD